MDKKQGEKREEWNNMKYLQVSVRDWLEAGISHLFIWLFNPVNANTYIWQ